MSALLTVVGISMVLFGLGEAVLGAPPAYAWPAGLGLGIIPGLILFGLAVDLRGAVRHQRAAGQGSPALRPPWENP